METLTDQDTKTCPRCNSATTSIQSNCTVCGAAMLGRTPVLSDPRRKFRGTMKLAVYFSSAAAFLLGIMEGFMNNNSAAMTADLFVSLVVLALTPRAREHPLSTLSACIIIAFAIPLILPLLNVVSGQGWMTLRLVFLFIPLVTLIGYATLNRNR